MRRIRLIDFLDCAYTLNSAIIAVYAFVGAQDRYSGSAAPHCHGRLLRPAAPVALPA